MIVESLLVSKEYLTRLRTMGRTNDASLLQLIHKTSGTIVANRELTLNHRPQSSPMAKSAFARNSLTSLLV